MPTSCFTPATQGGSLFWVYVVLTPAFVFDLFVALAEARRQADEARLDLRTNLRESNHSTLKTALYEDGAASAGVAIAALGLYLFLATGTQSSTVSRR